jgi:hypothetical protein
MQAQAHPTTHNLSTCHAPPPRHRPPPPTHTLPHARPHTQRLTVGAVQLACVCRAPHLPLVVPRADAEQAGVGGQQRGGRLKVAEKVGRDLCAPRTGVACTCVHASREVDMRAEGTGAVCVRVACTHHTPHTSGGRHGNTRTHTHTHTHTHTQAHTHTHAGIHTHTHTQQAHLQVLLQENEPWRLQAPEEEAQQALVVLRQVAVAVPRVTPSALAANLSVWRVVSRTWVHVWRMGVCVCVCVCVCWRRRACTDNVCSGAVSSSTPSPPKKT